MSSESQGVKSNSGSKLITSAKVRAFLMNDKVSVGLVVAVLGEILFFSLMSPYFMTSMNLINITRAIAVVGVVAVGETIVIISGGFDLSIGATMAASGMTSVYLVNMGVPLWVAFIAALSIGIVIGIINGVVISYAGINPLITTLATLAIVRGLGYIISKGQELPMHNESYLNIGAGKLFGVPYIVIILISMFLIFGFIMRNFRFGRYTYAIGSNAHASKLAGIPVGRWRILFYVTSSFLAAAGGILVVSRVGTAQPSFGQGIELLVITAVILGGTSLNGGKGTLLGTFFGLLLLGILNNGLILLSVPAYWQQVFQGTALLIAVLYDQWRQRT